MRLVFNALISKSLINFIESTLTLSFSKYQNIYKKLVIGTKSAKKTNMSDQSFFLVA
jgi:hypothetical protein